MMIKMMLSFVVSTVLGVDSLGTSSEIVVSDTFEQGVNTGGWTFGGNDAIRPDLGDPPPSLFGVAFDPPRVHTSGQSAFTGNYAKREVVQVAGSLRTYAYDSWTREEVTLWLVTNNGTPLDPGDDWLAYRGAGGEWPLPSDGWRKYSVEIPSGQTDWPSGWHPWPLAGQTFVLKDWKTLIENVEQVSLSYAPPGAVTNMPTFVVGGDNFEIHFKGSIDARR